jgi:hypothetical protein
VGSSLLAAGAVVGALVLEGTLEAAWPGEPVVVVVPFAAGAKAVEGHGERARASGSNAAHQGLL